jgi:protein phosphatase
VSKRVVEVFVPGAVVLVGAAGAGKSTLAAATFTPDEILSSDALRAAVTGDPADQSATRVAFGVLHRELIRRLTAARLVVVDATNLTESARAAVLRRASIAGAPAVALVLLPPAASVHARNRRRASRSVPADVVDRQLAAAAALGGDEAEIRTRLRREGFAAVHVWLGPEAEDASVEVVRHAPAKPPGTAADPVRPPG